MMNFILFYWIGRIRNNQWGLAIASSQLHTYFSFALSSFGGIGSPEQDCG